MCKRLVILVVAVLVVSSPVVAQERDDAENFTADLSGEQEVPAVDTQAAGVAGLSVDDNVARLSFVVVVFDIEEVVAAHIHCARQGENGPIGVTLFQGGPIGEGTIARGEATEPDEGNACGWVNLGDVVGAMRSGDTYVNVHTTANPAGEVRGQIEPHLPPPVGGGTFFDDDESVHEGDIETISAVGITEGCDPLGTNYCPDDPVTRGQMAAFIRRGFNLSPSGHDHFVDDAESIFEEDINAIADQGITVGCNPPDNDRYCPDDSMNRAQMASFLVRTFDLPAAGGDHFVDDDTSVHEANINSVKEAGVTVGCNPPDNDRYCPEDPVSRAHMASFLVRALQLRGMELPG